MALAPLPPPGWYPDPAGHGGQRYWDGQRWTGHQAAPPLAAPGGERRFTVNYGFALLAFFSLVGTLLFGLPLLATAGDPEGDVSTFGVLWLMWGGMWTLIWAAFAVQHTLRKRR
ncbi:hypothetical protein SEA_JAMIE19_32 [Mycobacterium phage Jamie19]|uniref:DUF2510 domain-containing protein n=15 Tax=Charlievirus TaxID=1623280 RepID=A0A142K7V5_9CAUD|nr:hypothetical protein CH20_gp33 [Mycobacterium phage MichelleMyBell]YP_009197160.1 hypothetical protein AVV74_gp35 [Mycobacterium phage Carcharodon]YP_009302346.1 hypothetical protein BJD69_gp32 [Mycobacterium phage Xeno]YP_009304939.1 hypothetical protein BJD70_gp31 [Mycobacterium phage Panchino]YP_009616888.1 hypothetical protein FDI84_gp35 [Mycobacterium phage Pipsqueaks]YP_010052104.1 hypothetical protein KD931_gp32 [Mycobacterium phage Andies]YP_010052171.1 hypothetical protein KD932_g